MELMAQENSILFSGACQIYLVGFQLMSIGSLLNFYAQLVCSKT